MKATTNLGKKLTKYFDTNLDCDVEKLPDVTLTEEEISAYDLAQYIGKEFYEVFNFKSQLESLLLHMQYHCTRPSVKKLFISNDGKIKKCCSINAGIYDGVPEIRLYESTYTEIPSIRIFNTNKDDEVTSYTFGGDVGDYWLTSSKEDLYCIEAHINEIKEIFNNQQYYIRYNTSYSKARELAQSKLELILKDLKFNYEIFKIAFIYDYNQRKIVPYLSVKDDYVDEIENYYTMIEIGYLISQITPNKYIILKKIPIKISELNPEIQNIINKQIKEEKLLPNKEKSLTRKRKKVK